MDSGSPQTRTAATAIIDGLTSLRVCLEDAFVPRDEDVIWEDLVDISSDWCRRWPTLPAPLKGAIRPYYNFVRKYRYGGITWYHRLYILFTGRFPNEL